MSLHFTVRIFAIFACVLMSAASAFGEEMIGGDVYDSGADASITSSASRDAFAAGFSARLDGDIGGDGHAAGFDVDIDGTIGSDLYVGGASVSIAGGIGEDVTAMGASIRLRESASVGGNARLMGGSVVIEGPIGGSLVATAGTITLNAPVDGDVVLTGGDLTFGDNARIAGKLTYTAPDQIDIPGSVIASDRIRYVKDDSWRSIEQWRDMAGESHWTFLPSIVGKIMAFAVTLAFLVLVAAIFLSVAPALVERGRQRIVERPGATFVTGILSLSALIGLVPVAALTLVGIPLVPIVILAIVLCWTLGYALGAYTLSLRVATAFWEMPDTTGAKLLALAAGLLVLAILNYVPVAGWLVNFTVVLLGLGAVARLITGRMSGTGSL